MPVNQTRVMGTMTMEKGRQKRRLPSVAHIRVSFEVTPVDDLQGCQMAKFDPFLSLDCARVEGVGAQSKERKGSNFAA